MLYFYHITIQNSLKDTTWVLTSTTRQDQSPRSRLCAMKGFHTLLSFILSILILDITNFSFVSFFFSRKLLKTEYLHVHPFQIFQSPFKLLISIIFKITNQSYYSPLSKVSISKCQNSPKIFKVPINLSSSHAVSSSQHNTFNLSQSNFYYFIRLFNFKKHKFSKYPTKQFKNSIIL